MTNPSSDTLLRLLHVADTAFPTGAFTQSWGLEALSRSGAVTRKTLNAFISAQLHNRWALQDRVFVAQAHAAHDDLDALIGLDREMDALIWSETARRASRTTGSGLLSAHTSLSETGLYAYSDALRRDKALGHLPIVEGLVHGAAGVDLRQTLAVSALGLVQRLVSAAIRLNLIGAVSAQTLIRDLRPGIAALASEIPPQHPSAFSPIADIGMMRHDRALGALFAS
ncbi:MAG: urease accessory UreF family protein [Pseudomonadota bacterium]